MPKQTKSYVKKGFFSLFIIFSESICFAQSFSDTSLQFEKQIFNAKNDSIKSDILLKKAIFYLENDSIHRAIGCVKSAFNLHKSSKSLIAIIQFSLLDNNVESSSSIIENYIINLSLNSIDNKGLIFIAAYYLNKHQISKSDYFIQELQSRNVLQPDFLKDSIEIKQKNVKLARKLNVVLPGLGVSYSGKIGVGILNLALFGVGSYFSFRQIKNRNYVTAFFSGISFTSRIYAGGINYSEKNVLLFNLEMKEIYCQNKIETLLNIED